MLDGDTVLSVKNLKRTFEVQRSKGAAYKTMTESLKDFMTLASVRNKTTETSEFEALKDINLEIGKGEVVGIIGKNGSGKSTLLKIISRVLEPSAGEIRMKGRLASLLEVGTGFHPELTGRENIYFNAAILGMTQEEVDERIESIIDFSEIRSFIDSPVKHYSSGMYVRLAFSVAIHVDPDILIVDEVLSVGDASFQRKCKIKIRQLLKSGKTVLFVSHSLPTIEQLCNRAVLLNQGEILAEGAPDEIIAQYLALDNNDGDVEQLEERRGKGDIRVKDLKLKHKGDEKLVNFTYNEKMAIDVELEELPEGDAAKNVFMDVRVVDTTNKWIMSYANKELVDLKKKKFSLTIPQLDLTEGGYFISIFIYSGEKGELQDVLKKAFTFGVKDEELKKFKGLRQQVSVSGDLEIKQ